MQTSQGSSDVDQEVIKGVIERLFPKKDISGRKPDEEGVLRRVLLQLLEGPKTTAEIAEYLESLDLNSGQTGVGKELANARHRLEQYYSSPEGFAQRFRVEIPKLKKWQQHNLRVTKNVPPRNATAFWAGHLSSGKPTRIVTGEPVFLHVPHQGWFLRQEGSNGESGIEEEALKSFIPNLRPEEIIKVTPYVARADLHAMLAVYSYFDGWSRNFDQPEPETLGSPATRSEVGGANLVILGTPFENEIVRALEVKAYENLRGYGENLFAYGSLHFSRSGKSFSKTLPNGEFRVWVIREWLGTHYETIIHASDSVVAASVCRWLTDDDEMESFIKSQWVDRTWQGFPAEFRMEFRVTLSEDGKRPTRVRVNEYEEMPGWAKSGKGLYQRAGCPGSKLPPTWRSIWD